MWSFVFPIAIVIIGLAYYIDKRVKTRWIARYGVEVQGTIIKNIEGSPNSGYRLGGNLNHATIQFMTKEGKTIVGTPVTGFITQGEVRVPSMIRVVYDVRKPERFSIKW